MTSMENTQQTDEQLTVELDCGNGCSHYDHHTLTEDEAYDGINQKCPHCPQHMMLTLRDHLGIPVPSWNTEDESYDD